MPEEVNLIYLHRLEAKLKEGKQLLQRGFSFDAWNQWWAETDFIVQRIDPHGCCFTKGTLAYWWDNARFFQGYDAKNESEARIVMVRQVQALANCLEEEEGISIAEEPARNKGAELSGESGKSIDVFISYSTSDQTLAEDLANRLRALQLSVFLSHDTITTGPSWRLQVGIALRRCTVAVVVLSTHSLDSDWVRYEIGALWALNKPVAPALIDCDASQLPELVRDFQARSVASDSACAVFCHEVEKLVRDTLTSMNS